MNGDFIEPASTTDSPTEHYNTVVGAWGNLLGENLHYGFFDSVETSLFDATEALTNQMLQAADFRAGMRAVDVGCGTGRAACRIAKEFGVSVTGISPSEECVTRAGSLAKDAGLDGSAVFAIGDGAQMAFEKESFDRVWVMESSHLIPDKRALLQECARVLRPGGKIVLCDIVLKQKLPLETVIEYRDEFLLLRDVFGRAIMEPLSFYTNSLITYGLQVEVQRDISEQTFPTFEHWRKNAAENRERVVTELSEEGWQKFYDACDVLEKLWRAEILGYGILSARS
ncbi:MAG: methyltransferase domain-containing protein [Halioglobus sp.]|nr:methyltransferase domain-containing protein [Halioglobus sp.]